MSVMRCFLNDRHVSDSRHRHVERSRDWGCAEREHINSGILFLELLLLRNTETLLLIDDYQSEVTELDILRDEPVRSYDNIDISPFEILFNFLLLIYRNKA